MLTNALRTLVNNLFKESFHRKKTINILTDFFFFLISHKSGVKTFLKMIVNQYLKGTHYHDPKIYNIFYIFHALSTHKDPYMVQAHSKKELFIT